MMRDKNLTLICRWPANSRILSPITYSPTPSKIDIGLFATNLKRTQIPIHFISDITEASRRNFGTEPIFVTDDCNPLYIPRNTNIYPMPKIKSDLHIKSYNNPQPNNRHLMDVYVRDYYSHFLDLPPNMFPSPRSPITADNNNVSLKDIMRVKYKLCDHLAISPNDKNTGKLRVECPVLVGLRIKKELYD